MAVKTDRFEHSAPAGPAPHTHRPMLTLPACQATFCRPQGSPMRRILVLAVVLATLVMALPALAAAPVSGRLDPPASDPVSLTAFVGQVRADAERAPVRSPSLQ